MARTGYIGMRQFIQKNKGVRMGFTEFQCLIDIEFFQFTVTVLDFFQWLVWQAFG